MPFNRTKIAESKVGQHCIQFSPGATTFVCTVTKVRGDYVWVKIPALLSRYDNVKLNQAASYKLIAGDYRSKPDE